MFHVKHCFKEPRIGLTEDHSLEWMWRTHDAEKLVANALLLCYLVALFTLLLGCPKSVIGQWSDRRGTGAKCQKKGEFCR